MVIVAYMDPGNYGTDISGGATFGYSMLWVVWLAGIMAMLLQYLSGKLGIATPVTLNVSANLQVPATVQAVLAARIDRLGEREKQVLQAAAVIGKDFAEPILRRVIAETARTALSETDLGAALRILKDAEFVYEQSLYPVAEYAFRRLLPVPASATMPTTWPLPACACARAASSANPRATSWKSRARSLGLRWGRCWRGSFAPRWSLSAASRSGER
jgi:hypothetical protein